jgi:hypothetical protein
MYIEAEADPAGTHRQTIEQQNLFRELMAKIAELKGVACRFARPNLRLTVEGRVVQAKCGKRNGSD